MFSVLPFEIVVQDRPNPHYDLDRLAHTIV